MIRGKLSEKWENTLVFTLGAGSTRTVRVDALHYMISHRDTPRIMVGTRNHEMVLDVTVGECASTLIQSIFTSLCGESESGGGISDSVTPQFDDGHFFSRHHNMLYIRAESKEIIIAINTVEGATIDEQLNNNSCWFNFDNGSNLTVMGIPNDTLQVLQNALKGQ